jgi:hypothetical protein
VTSDVRSTPPRTPTRARRATSALVACAAALAVFAAPAAATAQAAKPKTAAKKVPVRRLAISSTPPGAEVVVTLAAGADGVVPPAKSLGRTPIARAELPDGKHTLVATLAGHAKLTQELVVDAKSKALALTLKPVAQLQLRAAVPEAEGAKVTLNGRDAGVVPLDQELDPGRVLLEVTKPGFRSYSQWLDLTGGQTLQLPLLLQSEAKPVGQLFVTADLPGVPVVIDGQDKGVTPLSIDLPPGPVIVELLPKGLKPWKKTVTIAAGQKVIVEGQVRPESAPTGTALVLSDVPGTIVFVNGTRTGTAPVTVANLAPGTHVVEGKASGFQPVQTTLRVVAGEQSVVKLEPKPIEAEFGRISVRSSVPGAIVYVDGGERGPAPVELDKVALGPHAIIVRQGGFQDFEATCEVRRNEACSVMASLTPVSLLRVTSNVANAQVSIDGKLMGPTPLEVSLPSGEHKVRVEARDYDPFEQLLALQVGGEPRTLVAELRPTGAPTAAQEEDTRRRQAAFRSGGTHTGVPVGPGKNAMTLTVGMPYLVELRGNVGVTEGFAVGVALRTLERDTSLAAIELGLRAHWGTRPSPAFSFGAQLDLHLGTNFDNVTTRGGQVRLLGTLHFGDVGAFTLSMGGELQRDAWEGVANAGPQLTDVQLAGRFKAGATGVIWVSENAHVFFGLEKVVGDERLLLGKLLFGAFDTDPLLYANAGVTLSF